MNKLGIFINFWENSWDVDHIKYMKKVKDIGFDILEFQAQPLLEMTNEHMDEMKKAAADLAALRRRVRAAQRLRLRMPRKRRGAAQSLRSRLRNDDGGRRLPSQKARAEAGRLHRRAYRKMRRLHGLRSVAAFCRKAKISAPRGIFMIFPVAARTI